MPPFLPGLELCRLFYTEAVRPLLDQAHPGLRHAAARVGAGSEVLGFDTARSTDHDWGPRLELFLEPADAARHGAAIAALLRERLPAEIRGWPTSFTRAGNGVSLLTATTGPVDHRVAVADVGTWSAAHLGVDARRELRTADWLALPAQRLAEVTGGAVFRDDLGELTALRRRLRWYPRDVWRWLLAAQWQRIGQEEAFVGRTAEAGDELGSRLVAGRLARDVMRLCLLLARRYPPYSKWLGSAFAAVPDARHIAAALREALGTPDAGRRQAALCDAYERAGRWQNRLALADPVDATRRPFHDRPYPVIDAARFAAALRDRIADRSLAGRPPVGAVDQYVDSTDLLGRTDLTRAVTDAVYPS